MKYKTLLLTCIALAILVAGCKPADNKSTAEQIDQIKADTKAMGQDLKERDYTFAQKSEFTDRMKSQLAEVNQELDQLAAKIEKSSEAARAEAKPKLQALRDKAAELSKQIDKAKDATESTWDSVKAGSKKAYGELKDGFTQARQWVSEKIAP